MYYNIHKRRENNKYINKINTFTNTEFVTNAFGQSISIY